LTESVPDQKISKSSNDGEKVSIVRQWEYKVIHINMNSVKQADLPKQANPEVASKKLQGSLSPDFIRKEFPGMYKNPGQPQQPRHPAEQLQDFLNAMGREAWELFEISEVGPLQMFFFKRPKPPKPIVNSEENKQNQSSDEGESQG
jgi:hypothetical protein